MKETFLGQYVHTFGDRQVQFHSAALAFYLIIALPAFVVFFLSIAGIFIASDTLNNWLTFSGLVSTSTLENIRLQILQFSSVTAILSALLMIWSGSAIFHRVQQGLRDMWQVELDVVTGVRKFFANKLLAVIAALLFIIGIIGLFIFTQVATVFLTNVVDTFPLLPNIISVAQVLQFGLLMSVVVLVYALFGDSKVSVSLLFVGSLLVSSVLLLLQEVFHTFIAQLAAVSWYGAAGYVIILLFSLYLVGIIFYSGAIWMYVMAERSKTLNITPRSYAKKAAGSISLWKRITNWI